MTCGNVFLPRVFTGGSPNIVTFDSVRALYHAPAHGRVESSALGLGLVGVERDEVGREPGQVNVGGLAGRTRSDLDHFGDVNEMVVTCIDVGIDLLARLVDRRRKVAPVGVAEQLGEVPCGPVRLAVLADAIILRTSAK